MQNEYQTETIHDYWGKFSSRNGLYFAKEKERQGKGSYRMLFNPGISRGGGGGDRYYDKKRIEIIAHVLKDRLKRGL